MKTWHLCGALAAVLASACKPQGQSGVQSLGNYASGMRVRQNDCAGEPGSVDDKVGRKLALDLEAKHLKWELGSASSASKEAMLGAVKSSFAALPPDVAAMFLALQGQIVVTKDVNNYCTSLARVGQADQKALAESLDQVSACFWFMPPDDFEKVYQVRSQGKSGQILAVFVKDDVAEIKHGLVRAFGFLVAQVSPRLMTNDKTFTRSDLQVRFVEAENPGFRLLKRRIAEAFLTDLSGRPQAARFAQFGVKGKAPSVDKARFQDHVYAEAFDSMHCNAFAKGDGNTRQAMAREFPKTFAAFSSFPVASQPVKSGGSLSLALTVAAPSQTPASFGMWNPFKSIYNGAVATGQWVGTAATETYQGAGILYNEYADRRDKNIDRQTQDFMTTHGRAPNLLESASIGAYAVAKTGGQEVPLVDGPMKAATNFAEAIGGAEVDASGAPRELSTDERWARAETGTIATAVEVVPWGELAAGGGKVLAKSANGALDSGSELLMQGLASTGRSADLDTAVGVLKGTMAKDKAIESAGRAFNQATDFAADNTRTLQSLNKATGGAAGDAAGVVVQETFTEKVAEEGLVNASAAMGGYSGNNDSGYSGSNDNGYSGNNNGSGYAGNNSSGYAGNNSSGYAGNNSSGYAGNNDNGYSGNNDNGYSGNNSSGQPAGESTGASPGDEAGPPPEEGA